MRRRPIILASVVVAAASLLAAGCGGGGSPGVAGAPSATPGPAATGRTAALAFARCMRSHGVAAFPDPDSSGALPKLQVVGARNADPSRFDSASSACRRVAPTGGPGQTITLADRTDYLEAAACMRAHGFPGFPDPTFQANTVSVDVPPSIDQDSAGFRRAATTCTKLIPAGLPYSRSEAP
jgi:hypothetical protein